MSKYIKVLTYNKNFKKEVEEWGYQTLFLEYSEDGNGAIYLIKDGIIGRYIPTGDCTILETVEL